jgi:putative ABC transport system substrate-binding protein
MRRRQGLAGALAAMALGTPMAAVAQPSDKALRIGFLYTGSAPRPGEFSTPDAVLAGLRERGHLQLQSERLFADGQADRLPALAQQLLRWQPDLIVANLTPAALAAQRATQAVPIVMAGVGDAVASGLVQSLARPGGNITGVTAQGPELAAQAIELLLELRPGLQRLGVLANAVDPFTSTLMGSIEPAAARLGLALQVERVHAPAQYEAAFAAWLRQGVEAVFMQPSLPSRPAIGLALRHGLPSCSITRSFVEQGGLLAYTVDPVEMSRLVVDVADRVLRDTPPAQLPVQQSARFDLLINLRTAAALRLAVPAAVRARATELFE